MDTNCTAGTIQRYSITIGLGLVLVQSLCLHDHAVTLVNADQRDLFNGDSENIGGTFIGAHLYFF